MTRRSLSLAFTLIAAALLAGCFPRPDFSGLPDMSSVTVGTWRERLSLTMPPRPRDERTARLTSFLEGLPDRATPRYRVLVPAGDDAALYREWAVALGADGSRLSVVTQAAGTEPELAVTASAVTLPDCQSMLLAPTHVQHDNRATFAFGCATRGNLAAMIDDPADLIAPSDFGGGNAARDTAAVRRYLNDETKPLKQATQLNAK